MTTDYNPNPHRQGLSAPAPYRTQPGGFGSSQWHPRSPVSGPGQDPNQRQVPNADPTWSAQRNFLGGFGDFLGNQPLRRGDVPMVETALNFENYRLADQDRERAHQELSRAWGNVGATPSETLARELAVQRASGPGPGGAMRGAGAVAADDIRRSIGQDFGARGISGAEPGYEQARQLSALAADVAQRSAMADQEAGLANLHTLVGINEAEAQRRAALSELIANLYSSTERQPWDLSGLLEGPRHADRLVGGR